MGERYAALLMQVPQCGDTPRGINPELRKNCNGHASELPSTNRLNPVLQIPGEPIGKPGLSDWFYYVQFGAGSEATDEVQQYLLRNAAFLYLNKPAMTRQREVAVDNKHGRDHCVAEAST